MKLYKCGPQHAALRLLAVTPPLPPSSCVQVGLVALNLIGEPISPGPDMPPGGYLQLPPLPPSPCVQVGLVALNLIGEPIGPGPDMPPGGYLQLHPPITREVPYNNYAAADMADLNLDLHVDTVGRAGGGGGGHGRSEPGPSCGHGVCGGRWEGGVLAVWGEGGMGEVLCKMCATVCGDGGGGAGRAGGKIAAGEVCERGSQPGAFH